MSKLADIPRQADTVEVHDVAAAGNDSQRVKRRVVTVKSKLAVGFGGLIFLIAMNMGISMLEMSAVEERVVSAIEHRQPIVVRFLEYSDMLNLATTSLNGYLLTGHGDHKEKYYELEKKLLHQLEEIRATAESDRAEIDTKRLVEFDAAMGKFLQFASRLIYLRDNSLENYPGLALAREQLRPNAVGYLDRVSQLFSEVGEQPPSKQQQHKLILLSELRFSWQQMMNSIRLYFNSRSEATLDNLRMYDEQNQRVFKELEDVASELNFGGLEELEAYRSEWHKHLPDVIELYRGDAWRADAHLMKTDVRPIVEQLREIIFDLSSVQVAASREDGKALTQSLEQIYLFSVLILIVSLIFGTTLAVIISRSIVPPLQRLMLAAKQVAGGDLCTVVAVTRHDEVGQLSTSFNAMVRDLQLACQDKELYLEEVRNLNRKLEQRVEKKVEELKSTQDQLLQSEKLASIGQLAAGVAHEINNPVGYINSNVGSLKQYIDDLFRVLESYERLEPAVQDTSVLTEVQAVKDEVDLEYLKQDIVELIGESKEGVTRVKQIVQDLKDFSHVDEAEWQWTDLHKGLDSTLNVAQNEIKYKAEVVRDYGQMPEVECMPSQLNQVFLNLLVNAAHAIEEQGVITLRTGREEDTAWVAISDNGVGMEEDVQKRIFEPFFTTKPIGRGTGLGLSLSYGIVEKHGGRIEVESKVGKGTTFTIWLPIKQSDGDGEGIASGMSSAA